MGHTTSTHRLLYVCEHSCQHKTLSAKVNNTKKQRVKDQQRGLVSIKQHVFEGKILICNEKSKQDAQTVYTMNERTQTTVSVPL